MNKIVWLVLLAIPPWVAAELGAPKWVLLLTSAPLFIRAATLGNDSEEYLLGEGFAEYRGSFLAILIVGGLVLGVVLLVVFQAFSGQR